MTVSVKVKQRVKADADCPTRMQALRDALKTEWDKKTMEKIQALVDTMPERIRPVNKANGEHATPNTVNTRSWRKGLCRENFLRL
jgi:hypothetical protein